MITQSLKSRTVITNPEALLTELFRTVATDLSLWNEEKVLAAYSLLAGGRYRSFLKATDAWTRTVYGSHSEHLRWNQLACLLKKYPFPDDSIDRDKAAMEKFVAAESRCRRQNRRWSAYLYAEKHGRHSGRSLRFHDVVKEVREYIAYTIGDTPDYESIWDMCDYGPGASVGVGGSLTHVCRKIDSKLWTVTPACAGYALAAVSRNVQLCEALGFPGGPSRQDYGNFVAAFESRLDIVLHNKITTVPKTALINRTIAVEPLLNGFVQKGIDLFMRRRLLRRGVNLTDQTKNQTLARLGSENGFNPFCTIDLSAASDSISRSLVKALLPPAWYEFLNAVRSPYYLFDGELHRYEKFTSMGNGFCFPLQSLIFSAVVHSVYKLFTRDRTFAVYGDDIIVRQSSALLVLEILNYMGFKPNTDKTFITGSFRESCGADWFNGFNVRPYYLDDIPTNWSTVFGWLNSLRRIGAEHSWNLIFEKVPARYRYLRPEEGDDSAISCDRDLFMGSRYAKWHKSLQRWSWVKLVSRPYQDSSRYSEGALMYGVLRGAVSNDLLPLELTHRNRVKWVPRRYPPINDPARTARNVR